MVMAFRGQFVVRQKKMPLIKHNLWGKIYFILYSSPPKSVKRMIPFVDRSCHHRQRSSAPDYKLSGKLCHSPFTLRSFKRSVVNEHSFLSMTDSLKTVLI